MTETKPGRKGPLQGIRILDLTRVISGPFTTKILSDLGAEVIKVEERQAGDSGRSIAPFVDGMSHYFIAFNHNKKGVSVDARTPEGRQVLLDLARKSDVLVENFRAGVRDRLGLSTAALHEVNPRLIVCSITGYGQHVSERDKPSYDLVTQARSGIMSVNGDPSTGPMKIGVPMADIGAGLWAAIGILSALQHRNATGEGLEIDLSMLDGLISMMSYIAELFLVTGKNPGQPGNRHHSVVPYGVYPVKDGSMVLALHHIGFWEKFCRAIDRMDLYENPRYHSMAARQENRAEFEPLIMDILLQKTGDEWHAILDPADIPHGVVHNMEQALGQGVVQERGLLKTFSDGAYGDLRVVGSPLQFPGSSFEGVPMTAPPRLGEHTAEVLRELLGYDSERIEQLSEAGVVGPPRSA